MIDATTICSLPKETADSVPLCQERSPAKATPNPATGGRLLYCNVSFYLACAQSLALPFCPFQVGAARFQSECVCVCVLLITTLTTCVSHYQGHLQLQCFGLVGRARRLGNEETPELVCWDRRFTYQHS